MDIILAISEYNINNGDLICIPFGIFSNKDEAELFVKMMKKDLDVKYLSQQIVREAFPNLNFPKK